MIYQTREIQRFTGTRFTIGTFNTAEAAHARADAHNQEWGVAVDVIEVHGVVVRILATYPQID